MTIGEHSKEYLEYLKSPAWKKKRAEKLAAQSECENAYDIRYRLLEDGTAQEVKMCSGNLEVHHIHYRSLGREELYDLKVLCEFHHAEEHKMWKVRTSLMKREYSFRRYRA